MTLAILHTQPGHLVGIHAAATPPRDRTSRTQKELDRCRAEWHAAFELAQSKGQTTTRAARLAAVAYKLAMPKLDNLPAIKACIACIAQGVTLEVFTGRDASQLLYAAQVALTLHHAKGARKP